MKNEIGRKITSLTLMTIMVAGGLTFAVPGVMPSAFAANANLFVSAENSQFSNYMAGPQVIEVVIIDPDIDDTDEAKGEPDVTVNGKKLRMAQAVDGNWYGYFADRKQAIIADATAPAEGSAADGNGLDFGTFCSAATAATAIGTSGFTETTGVAISGTAGIDGEVAGALSTAASVTFGCGANALDATIINVVREEKQLNGNALGNPGGGSGQIVVDGVGAAAEWPFIQLYNLSPGGNVVVQYNKGGGTQTTTLTFDTVDQFADIELDRTKYPRNAQVHTTVTDLWLNIDPTDEDSWTFGTTGTLSTNYQVFNENGDDAGALVAGGVVNINTGTTLSDLMCEDNCILILDVNAQSATNDVVTIQDNDDSDITCLNATAVSCGLTNPASGSLAAGTQPVTITELGPSSGIFGTYDEADTSVIKTTSLAKRGSSATIDYNETPTTILIGFSYANIDIQPTDDEWSSGEEIPVVLVDADANKNSRADEDLDINNADISIIPTLRTGSPFTLASFAESPVTAVFLTGIDGLATITPFTDATTGNFTSQTASDATQVNQTGNTESTSDRLKIEPLFSGTTTGVGINAAQMSELLDTITDTRTVTGGGTLTDDERLHGTNLLNYDVRALGISSVDIYLVNNTVGPINVTSGAFFPNSTFISLVDGGGPQGLVSLNNTAAPGNVAEIFAIDADDFIGLAIANGATGTFVVNTTTPLPIVVDFFSFGFTDDGVEAGERIANQIIRLELEESGDNTSTFEGSLEYVMVNQLNILVESTYLGISPIADDPSFIVIEDLTDEDSPRVTYDDLAQDGTILPVADQEEAPSHSGVVSFDFSSYKIADTVTITLQDGDLNVDSDLIDIFTVVSTAGDPAIDAVGSAGLPVFDFGPLGRLLDVTYDDQLWTTPTDPTCLAALTDVTSDTGLEATGFTLVETDVESGVFVGDFAVPPAWCRSGATAIETTTGLDLEVNYVDFRDASGEIIEVGDSAGIRANTGSVSLDRTVYPVPFGTPDRFPGVGTTDTTPKGRSVFPIHQSGMGGTGISSNTAGLDKGEFVKSGILQLHIRVNDPDFDISPEGEDFIAQDKVGSSLGPVKISIIREAQSVVIGFAGGDAVKPGRIDAGAKTPETVSRDFGPITEIAPDAGIFEVDVPIRYTDGPSSASCPVTPIGGVALTGGFVGLIDGNGDGDKTDELDRFDTPATDAYCILQGDIIQVEYTDPEDASGDINTVTDSATFDLRNGVLQSDKSVYIIGSDMILTLIEPDFDLDNDAAETYTLDLVEWDSDAATVSMGIADGQRGLFDPEPTDFRETGDSTGIFQIVIEIPEELDGDRLERGEEIVLEYTDWGPSGSDFVGDEDEDVNLTIFTSNFGATVELDQKVYTWTDKVYITIVAPDHNFDSDLVDEIGNTDTDPIKVATRGHKLSNYKLVETGTDTGIFTGEVILTGFAHDADGDNTSGVNGVDTNPRTEGQGPTNGFIRADDDDGITISFEFSEDETVVGSALIRWNIGEVQWLEASYPASGTGVVRIVDPDMNLNPESVDNFNVDVWSDSDAGGIDLTVTETNEATGIFEGTVFFTVTDESSGHRLRVSEGDTITAEYEDNTLPDPYTTADELDITGTSLIGTIVPPLERAPAANARVVDAFGNSLASVSVDQQVQITADLANGQDREQSFAYLVQVQDGNGVTIALAWISGSLSAGQSFSPALSWTPDRPGTYEATVFVWESVDNPTALSPPVSVTISVS